MTEIQLSVRSLTLVRGERRVLEIDALDVYRGETLVVLGPNGAGKTTLLQLIALLDRPGAGEILADGVRVDKDILGWRRRMALVFQEPLLLDTSVERNVGSGLSIRGVPRLKRRQRVHDWLERFAITRLAKRSARTLSGGEAQRTSIARAMVLEPELLLLDEPFAALDAPTKQSLIDDFERVLAEARTTTVLVTHDRGEALRLGHRVAVLMDGRVRQIGTAAEVFGGPVDEEVAEFVGIETIVRGEVERVDNGLASVRVGSREIRAATLDAHGGVVLVCVRPEDVILSQRGRTESPSSARNRLDAVVKRVVSSGAQVRVELDAGFPLVALITSSAREEVGIDPGAAVAATFKATAVHLIPVSR